MKPPFKFTIVLLVLLVCAQWHRPCFGDRPFVLDGWEKLSDKHFVVYFSLPQDTELARNILNVAEQYYNSIADQIGYARYSDFWTWNERVTIILFPDQISFSKVTGQPTWSRGYAHSDSRLFSSRVIVTFKQEGEFLTGLLPHEISHLILNDHIGFDRRIPVWFDEGVAQLQEENKESIAQTIAKYLVIKQQHIPLDVLNEYNIRTEGDPQKVTAFYAQSYSVVKFLIRNYGIEAFRKLCRYLKEGKTFEDSLKSAYYPGLTSLKQLEEKWIASFSGF